MVVVSSMFIVTYGSILMVTALKSRPGDSGICVALVLVSGYCLFFFFISFEITLVLDVVSDL